ncbi:MAG: APC family permease [Vulcanisaeta sp.]
MTGSTGDVGKQGVGLRKELSLLELTIIGLVGAVGTGILFSAPQMMVMSGPAVILEWVLGGIFYFIISLTYMEMATLYPEAGGPARYAYYTHGPITNLLNAWASMVWYLFIPPAEAIAVVYAINYFTHNLLTPSGIPTWLGAGVAALFILLMVPFNYFGVKFFGQTTTGIGILKLILYLIIPAGLLAVVFMPQNIAGLPGGFVPYGFAAVFSAIPLGMFAFGGTRVIPDYAEEMKNPQRDAPLAILLVVVGQTLVYVLFAATYVLSLKWSAFGVKPGDWADLTAITSSANPVMYIAGTYGLGYLLTVATIVGILGPFVVGYIYLGGGSRVFFSMYRSKYVSQRVGEIHEKYAIPYWALIIFGLAGLVLALLSPIPTVYTIIEEAVVAGYLGFSIVPVSLVVSRRQGLSGIYKVPAPYVIGALAFIFATWIVYWSGWPATPYGVLLVFVLSIIFAIAYKVRGAFKNSIWYIVYMLVMVLMTYIGQTAGGPVPILKFPWDMVVVTILAIVFYVWGIYSGLPKPYETPPVKS